MSETIVWPIVKPDDARPAGPADQCFYCQQPMGQVHRAHCVLVTKRIRVRYIFEIELDVPQCWSGDDFESYRNESGWCADNAPDAIEEFAGKIRSDNGACLCDFFKAEYIELVDHTPRITRRSGAPKPPHDSAQ